MTGLEKMLASMLGISAEEMQATINNAVTLLGNIDTRFTAIENKQDIIIQKLDSIIAAQDFVEIEETTNGTEIRRIVGSDNGDGISD